MSTQRPDPTPGQDNGETPQGAPREPQLPPQAPPVPQQPASVAAAQYGQVPPYSAQTGATQPLPPEPQQPEYQQGQAQPEHQHAAVHRGTGAGKLTALLLAAALVGGAAGVGGSFLYGTFSAQPSASGAQPGPSSITVNNPGSVNETTAIATEVLPSVVTIDVQGGGSGGSGSGVIISADGYVVTNTHVVTLGGQTADARIRVTASDGRIYEAEVVGTDPTYDLAVIKLKDADGLTPVSFADSSKLNVGSTTVAVGAPLGLSNTVTTGVVSALNRSIEIASSEAPDGDSSGKQGDSPFQFDFPGGGGDQGQQEPSSSIAISVIQTDAAINPGNSGGALVDSKGKLIGINVAIATAGGAATEQGGSIGLGFAIPSKVVQRVADEIIKDGSASHGLLGASVTPATAVDNATVAGAYVQEVTPGGAAEAAGLRPGDIVTELNGVRISDAIDLTAQVRAAAAGSKATLTYVRDGKTAEAEVTLGTMQ